MEIAELIVVCSLLFSDRFIEFAGTADTIRFMAFRTDLTHVMWMQKI